MVPYRRGGPSVLLLMAEIVFISNVPLLLHKNTWTRSFLCHWLWVCNVQCYFTSITKVCVAPWRYTSTSVFPKGCAARFIFYKTTNEHYFKFLDDCVNNSKRSRQHPFAVFDHVLIMNQVFCFPTFLCEIIIIIYLSFFIVIMHKLSLFHLKCKVSFMLKWVIKIFLFQKFSWARTPDPACQQRVLDTLQTPGVPLISKL